jgi:mannosyltransferase OCH1-like enzyme
MLLSRRWRTRTYLCLLLTWICYLLRTHLPSPPKWQNDNRANRKAPRHETQEKPDFLYDSRFRRHPNLELEASLEIALTRIEIAAPLIDEFPVKKIWQTAKSKEERPEEGRLWEEGHPDWEYEVRLGYCSLERVLQPLTACISQLVTDQRALDFIKNKLFTVPLLATSWSSYPFPVLRADLLRYLLLWYYGGYYSDIDAYPVRSISSCAPISDLFAASQKHNISLVVGVEIDEPHASSRTKKLWHWSRTYGFIQYSMYAPNRFSPFLRRVIVRALAHSHRHSEDTGTWFHGPQYSEEDILEVTGPGMFTDALLDVLSETLPRNHHLVMGSMAADEGFGELDDSSSGSRGSHKLHRVTWAPFHVLKDAIWIDETESEGFGRGGMSNGGLMVLPINVWGNGQRHSEAEGFESTHACVNHRFGRTWKKGWWEYLVG